jgi:hypothetical protein
MLRQTSSHSLDRPHLLAKAAKDLELEVLCFCSSPTGHAMGQARMLEAVRMLGIPRSDWSSDELEIQHAENALLILQKQVGAAV